MTTEWKKTTEWKTTEWKRGVEAAAALASEYDGCSTHAYRLEDCILGKLNVTRRTEPRRNKRQLQDPKDARLANVAWALAEMHHRLIYSSDRAVVCAIARDIGLTIAEAKRVGVSRFYRLELKRAGVL